MEVTEVRIKLRDEAVRVAQLQRDLSDAQVQAIYMGGKH